MFTLAPSGSTVIGRSGPNAELMDAITNTAGQVGGILSPIVLSRLVGSFNDWSPPLIVMKGNALSVSQHESGNLQESVTRHCGSE